MTRSVAGAWVLPLDAPEANRERAGGKGSSLASLARAGFPVPAGFLVTTDAYRQFVAANQLEPAIAAALAPVAGIDPISQERAAASIQEVFALGIIPPEIAVAILRGYTDLGRPAPAVAVRSSATTEDLPGLSFAGQQETFLNVIGESALLDAVRRCWASLWTARAIGYRQQMEVSRDEIAMAVVVQVMVPAEVSGVLFTVNPATGERGEIVVEAAFGLGEALVGGAITPKSHVVARDSLAMTSFSPGVTETPAAAPTPWPRGERALPEALLRELVQLGLSVERLFAGTPQDIEWAVAADRVWLLQSRPITKLPPPLADVVWESPLPGATWVRRQVVEHMPEPLSPLFAELYLEQGLERSIDAVARAMGAERLFALMLDGPFFTTVNGFGYSRGNWTMSLQVAPLLARAMISGPLWIFRHGVEYWREEGLFPYLETIARWREVDPVRASDTQLLRGMRELAWADARYWFGAAIAIGTAKVSDWVLDGFLSIAAPGRDLRSGHFLRGFPSKTLEAEAELDAIARRVRASGELREYVISTPAERLRDELPATRDGDALRKDLERYFARHGHQIYDLDFVAPTLVDAPLPVLLGLKALVREPDRDALARQADVVRQRDRLTEETAESFAPVRRFLFRHLTRWAQSFAPYREDALFYVGAAWPMLRRFALELGQRLAAAGSLSVADDVFFLESSELEQAITARARGAACPDLMRLGRERRELREWRQRLHPPAAVPPTSRMRVGWLDLSERETQRRNEAGATTLIGFPVSTGRVTAPASVIFSPADFAKMEPGTILVCPTTTPAWTPLFAQARGLVTDIGGILGHGSIVAREYGIPAVMGTGNATQRIVTGQEITVDGSAGTVALGTDVRC